MVENLGRPRHETCCTVETVDDENSATKMEGGLMFFFLARGGRNWPEMNDMEGLARSCTDITTAIDAPYSAWVVV